MLHGLYPNRTFKDDRSRNEGLIDVSKDEIEETRKWGEHSAQVYLDTRTVQVSYNTISCDEWVAAYADEGKTEDDFERLPVSPYDYLDEISFEAVIDTNQHPEYSEHFMKVPEEPDWAFDPCC